MVRGANARDGGRSGAGTLLSRLDMEPMARVDGLSPGTVLTDLPRTARVMGGRAFERRIKADKDEGAKGSRRC